VSFKTVISDNVLLQWYHKESVSVIYSSIYKKKGKTS